ncbi:MAG: hypothetical protein E7673_02440 [Ruminococcaceae bacterium]|nr:hypothetical protein [Oscillospiraceae bacterium]
MRNLMILVKMQLKERLNFKRLDVKNVKKFNIVISILGTVLKFAMVFALCFAFLFVAKKLSLFAPNRVPGEVMSLLFSAMLLASVFSCVVGLTKSVYYANDNAVLLTLPCKPVQVYLSKIVIFFIFELKRNLSFMVPLFIAYFFTHGYGFFAYIWMLVCVAVISLLTVAIGALLSIPSMWIASFFKQRKWLQMSLLVISVAAAVYALFAAISLIPEDINIIKRWYEIQTHIHNFFYGTYPDKFAVLNEMTVLFLGERNVMGAMVFPLGATAIKFLILLGVTAALLVLGVLIVKPMFYSMASKPFEYLKKPVKPKTNKARPRRWSAVYHEWLIACKSSSRMSANVGVLVAIPMLILLLNKIFLAMSTRTLGDHMVVAFNVLIILLVSLNANCSAASIFSREGRSSYLVKTQPSKYSLLILSKLMPNTVFACASIVATFVIMIDTLAIEFGQLVLLMLGILFIYLAHMLYSAEFDLMNPQIEIYATVGNSESNPNETKSTVLAFVISFVTALAVFLLLAEGSGNVFLKLVIVSLALLCYRMYVFFAKLRLYYNEK